MYKNKSNLDIVRSYLNNERPFIMTGYTGDVNKYREEGELWTDTKGIEWKRKNGKNVRVTKTQADVIREAIGTQKCKCGLEIKWGNKFDRLFFSKTGMCQDCLIEYEHKLHLTGLFPLYEKCKIYSNQIGFLKDIKAKLQETIEYFSNNDGNIEILCNSNGFQEKFHGTNKEKILEDAKRDLQMVEKYIKEINKEKTTIKKELKQNAAKFKLKIYV